MRCFHDQLPLSSCAAGRVGVLSGHGVHSSGHSTHIENAAAAAAGGGDDSDDDDSDDDDSDRDGGATAPCNFGQQ